MGSGGGDGGAGFTSFGAGLAALTVPVSGFATLDGLGAVAFFAGFAAFLAAGLLVAAGFRAAVRACAAGFRGGFFFAAIFRVARAGAARRDLAGLLGRLTSVQTLTKRIRRGKAQATRDGHGVS